MIDPKLIVLLRSVVDNAAVEGGDPGTVCIDGSEFDGLVDYLKQGRYAQDGGSHCPVCGSPHLSTERYTEGHDYSWEGCTCATCKSTWRNRFDLIGFSDLVSA